MNLLIFLVVLSFVLSIGGILMCLNLASRLGDYRKRYLNWISSHMQDHHKLPTIHEMPVSYQSYRNDVYDPFWKLVDALGWTWIEGGSFVKKVKK